jgi:hypothetical protein
MRRLLWRNLKGDAAPHLPKKFRFKKFRKDCCGCVAFYGGTLKAMPHRTYQKSLGLKSLEKIVAAASPFMAEP